MSDRAESDVEDSVPLAEVSTEAAPRSRPNLAEGAETIRAVVRTLPNAPGVYRMIDDKGDALYVGKARSLKKRVYNYTQTGKLPVRLQRMVSETRSMEVMRTHTEVEALLLESNLIKRLRPRFNVLLRDDKSFPYILLTGDHPYPQIVKHRGSRARKGGYYGPFASAGAVDRTVTALQRAFLLRICADTIFSVRTRPCLQYQIKRCSAPCVGKVSPDVYAGQVELAKEFLAGKSRDVQTVFAREMQAASDRLDFETAAQFRDRVRALSAIQSQQDINVEGLEDADAIAAFEDRGQVCIQVFFFRAGRNYGNRAYFPKHDDYVPIEEVLAAFVAQFYEDKPAPPLILLSHDVPEMELIAEALAVGSGQRVELNAPKRGGKKRLIDHALANAKDAHARKMAEGAAQTDLLEGVAKVFGLGKRPERIEVYDNSHISGTNAGAAMIVAGPEGFQKSAYRKFNIRGPVEPGDDYAMMREVLTRRFGRAQREDAEGLRLAWPDLALVDGGQGQLNAAVAVLQELGITDVPIAAIAKGPDRDAGRERFFMPGRESFMLGPRDPVLFFLQRLRDEAHRFAIGAHRAKRVKALGRSQLDDVPGIGPLRKKALLHHFGSARAIARAGLSDLESVGGISKAVAKKIYDHFHTER